MARKLKSDKVLFLAVLFLVCVSAVMVSRRCCDIGGMVLLWWMGVGVMAGVSYSSSGSSRSPTRTT